ncbi:hypothetical protein CAPTEDRAFT_208330 [Capitella teleta]|uniref:LRRCT domain-containing protein n=1 Tax=Capitella teleta TaxID=283909 RepID=R7V0E6_CAPTE|nr:hypothetical protein CAPTEDRAFT_208330 [Capitella teleta]|eukprot:ELU09677.1 hypothetical protein CAPTEDRAFT_208330 [Capitella teleta]
MDILRLIWLIVCLVSNLNVEETFGVHVSFIDQGRSSVPDEMNPNMTILDIWNNEISVIKQTDFNDKYPALNIVNLDKNQIVYIENGCFRGTSLNFIYLSSNQLTAIPDFHEVSTTLTNLGLKANKITEITANEISYLTKLERLYLSSNPIVSLADMHKNLPSLFRLGVEGIPFQCCCSVAWLKRIPDLLIDTNPCTHPWKWNSFSLDQITEEMLQEQPCGTSSAQLYLCDPPDECFFITVYVDDGGCLVCKFSTLYNIWSLQSHPLEFNDEHAPDFSKLRAYVAENTRTDQRTNLQEERGSSDAFGRIVTSKTHLPEKSRKHWTKKPLKNKQASKNIQEQVDGGSRERAGVSDVFREIGLVVYLYSKKVYAFNFFNNRNINGHGKRITTKRIFKSKQNRVCLRTFN